MPKSDDRVSENCKHWKKQTDTMGVCERCGVQWQYMEVGAGYKCPHFERRS